MSDRVARYRPGDGEMQVLASGDYSVDGVPCQHVRLSTNGFLSADDLPESVRFEGRNYRRLESLMAEGWAIYVTDEE